MSLARLKVPALITSSIVCFMLGIGAGVGAMSIFGYSWDTPRILGGRGGPSEGAAARGGPGGGGPGVPGGGMPGGGGGMPGAGGGGMPGAGGGGMPGGMAAGRMGGPMGAAGGGMPGGRQPNSKAQLASLVVKLDQLANNSLSIRLTDEQRKKIRTQLAGLEEKEDLSDDEAKQKLDAILEIVNDQKNTLEAAGYRAGGQAGGGRRPNGDAPPNPFKEDDNGKHLKSLQETLAKGPPA
jgi:hypothetical protein